MKKILIRSGIDPFENLNAGDLIRQDFIGGNSGNLIFAHAIIRNLTTDNIKLESDHYRAEALGAEFVNENYEAFVIPLADAFRPDFVGVLKNLTSFIKELKIPVYLIGAGIRAPYNVSKDELKFKFDDVVRDFVRAVLDKSSMVGLRGDITSQYLTNLGFKEGRDHRAIGCPSMYTFGENLNIRDVDLSKGDDLLLATNRSKSAPPHVLQYIHELHNKYSNAAFIPQGLDEFKLLYTGVESFDLPNYPSNSSAIEYSTGNAKFFLSAPAWIDYLETRDFTFGTKLHGNITATIAGTPSISIPIDGRMNELATFHNLATLRPEQISNNDSLASLIEKVDLKSAEKKQVQNYKNFIDFLKINEIDYTYQDATNKNDTPYDKFTKNIKIDGPVESFEGIDLKEAKSRVDNVYRAQLSREKIYVNRQKKQIQKINELKENEREILIENEKLNKAFNDLELRHKNTLNRKAVKIPLAIADKFSKNNTSKK